MFRYTIFRKPSVDVGACTCRPDNLDQARPNEFIQQRLALEGLVYSDRPNLNEIPQKCVVFAVHKHHSPLSIRMLGPIGRLLTAINVRITSAEEWRWRMATILILDDDPANVDVFALVLQAYGHRVLRAASGGQALELSTTYPASIQILMSDVAVPDLSGTEVAVQVV